MRERGGGGQGGREREREREGGMRKIVDDIFLLLVGSLKAKEIKARLVVTT